MAMTQLLGYGTRFKLATLLLGVCRLFTIPCGQSTSSEAACQVLNKTLGPTKTKFSGQVYESSVKGARNLFNQLDDPTCIVFPQNTSDVIVAMRAIYESDSHYAVRGGGHSGMVGWDTVENGVLIDFSEMKAFSYNKELDSITMEPGVRSGEVCDGLQAQGVSPVGGRESDVGISGLLLGGGLSFLSPAHGYSCDSFRSLEVVLPTGQLVTATRTNEYSDLFRALKGGGNRFGIVTKFEVDAIHTGTALDKTWYGGTIQYSSASALALVQATDKFTYTNRDPRAVALVIITFSPLDTPASSEAFLFYNGTEAEFNHAFAEFLAIQSSAAALRPLSYNDVTKVLPPGSAKTNGYLWVASALYPNQGRFEEAYVHWTNFSNTFQNEFNTSSLLITPVPQNQIDVGNANGGTAFSPPDGEFAVFMFAVIFPAGVTVVSPELLAGTELLSSQVPRSPGLPLYLNESEDTQDALTTYNWYHKLKQVYAKYDPTRFNIRRMLGPNGL